MVVTRIFSMYGWLTGLYDCDTQFLILQSQIVETSVCFIFGTRMEGKTHASGDKSFFLTGVENSTDSSLFLRH